MSSDAQATSPGAVPPTPSPELLAAVVDRAREGWFIADADGRVVLWNQACRELIGPEPGYLVPHGQAEYVILEADAEAVCPPERLPANRARRGEYVERETFVCVRPGREPVVFEATAWPWPAPDGRFGAMVRLDDVTARSRAEQARAQSEGQFQGVVETMLDCLAVLSTVRDEAGRAVDLRYDYLNPAAERAHWTPPEETLGRCYGELFPGLRDSMLRDYLRVVETGEPLCQTQETYADVVHGRRLSAAYDVRASRLGDGLLLVWRNVTDEVRSGQALAESEGRFRAVLEHLTESAILFDVVRDEQGRPVDLRYTYFNPICEQTYWASPSRCLGRTYREIHPELVTAGHLETYLRVLETGEPYLAESVHRIVKTPAGEHEGYYDLQVFALGDGVAMFYREITDRVLAQRAVVESEARFRSVLENLNEGAVLYSVVRDAQGQPCDLRYEYLNRISRQTYWVPADACLGRCYGELFRDPEAQAVLARYLRVAATGEPLESDGFERRMETPEGPREGYFDVRVTPMGDGVAVFYREVTDRVLTQRALAESEARFRAVLENLPEGALLFSVVTDEQGRPRDLRYEYMNPACSRIHWLPVEDCLGRRFSEMFPELAEGPMADYLRVIDSGEPLEVYGAYRAADTPTGRREAYFDLRAVPLGAGLALFFRDVTERVLAEQALRESEERFRTALDNLSDSFVLMRAIRDDGEVIDFEPVYWNPAAERHEHMRGRIGWRLSEWLSPEALPRAVAAYRTVMETGRALVREAHPLMGVADASGQGRCFDSIVVRLGDGVAVCFHDVTERVRAEQTLRESEARFRTALDTMSDCFALFGAVRDEAGQLVDLRYEYINETGAAYHGLPPERLVGATLLDLFPALRGSELFRTYVEVVETGRPWESAGYWWDQRADQPTGEAGALDVRATRHGDGLAVAWRDVTDRVRAEAALRESEALFRGGFEQSPLGMALLSPDGQCLRANRVLTGLLETGEAHLLGHRYEAFLHPQERGQWQESTRALLAGQGEVSTELRWVTETGATLWAHVTRTIVRTADDAPWYVLLQVQDIGRRKLAEQELVQRQAELERSNRELAQFAHIASHDLQEPVRKIQVLGSRLERLTESSDEQLREHVRRMTGSARRMSELVDGLLRYSRLARTELVRAPVPLGALVEEVRQDLEVAIAEAGATVEVGQLPTVLGDAAQLRELFANLLANALKFRREGVPLAISVTAEPFALGVELSVRDNGIGFESQYAERIFQPFQQLHTRAEYAGTGMGLAIAQRVAVRHDMEIRAYGEPGRGATFVVRIPRVVLRRER